MSAQVLDAARSLREALAQVDPAARPLDECARLAEELAVTENMCAAVRLAAAARVVEAGAHRDRGFADGAAWVAARSGTTGWSARRDLETVEALFGRPDTAAAVQSGAVSIAQAREIIAAEARTPGAEAVLLPVARLGDLSQLRDRAREHRLAWSDAGQLRDQQRAAREFRHWQDRDGLVRIAAALPPETGLPLVKRVRAVAERMWRAATVGEERPERFEAYAADALAAVVAGPGGGAAGAANGGAAGSGARAELVIVSDLHAWRRGHPHDGEVCHIIDGGPIPVAVAKELTEDAFVKAVLHDGTRIHTVAHYGRHLPAPLRTALDLGPVPAFTGRECVDCGRRYGLEYDHVDPVAHHGATAYDNLEARCWPDHKAKTERDRRSGLLGPHPPRPPNRS